MTENVSDQHGRAFEYAITCQLSQIHGAVLTIRAMEDQERDAARFGQLPQELAEHFTAGAQCIANHIHCLLPPGTDIENVQIDRLPDTAGTAAESNVTDIQLGFRNHIHLNLSIKNNHFALKHQRPPSLMQQLGFAKNSLEDIEYRTGLNQVYAIFYQRARALSPDAVNFRDLTAIQPDFIDTNLYAPVCDYVIRQLTERLVTPETCRHFFSFLVGETDFTKIILLRSHIEVMRFNAIPMPTECTVQHLANTNNYILLFFDNGWQMSLRLHTASSVMGDSTPSLKFDTQGRDLPLPKEEWEL